MVTYPLHFLSLALARVGSYLYDHHELQRQKHDTVVNNQSAPD